MTTTIQFFKAPPEPDANVQWPEREPGVDATFTLVALERSNDPDASHHGNGFDYFGAYGDAADITAWAAGQPVTAVPVKQLPNPLTFYPTPFNEA